MEDIRQILRDQDLTHEEERHYLYQYIIISLHHQKWKIFTLKKFRPGSRGTSLSLSRN